MSATDPYDFVLRDLRAQRDNINMAIEAIERVRGMRAPASADPPVLSTYRPLGEPPTAAVSGPAPMPPPLHVAEDSADQSYAGLTIYEAAIRVLRAAKAVQPTSTLTDAIQEGGLKLNAADPYNTVGSVLTRRFFDHGDIVRVGRGLWGLPDWFPNRDHRAEAIKKRDDKRASDSSDASDSELDMAGVAEPTPESQQMGVFD